MRADGAETDTAVSHEHSIKNWVTSVLKKMPPEVCWDLDIDIRVGYRLQKPYRGIPRYSATYRGTYHGIP